MDRVSEDRLVEAERLLKNYLRAELPESWPTGAAFVEPRTLAATEPPRTFGPRWVLAMTALIAFVGIYAAAVTIRPPTAPLPDGAGPPTARRPAVHTPEPRATTRAVSPAEHR